MKSLALAALLALSAPTYADTIALGNAPGFQLTQQFPNVPNDAGAAISVYPAVVYVDGVAYKGTGEFRQSDDGRIIDVTLVLSTYRTCTHQGRGQTCSTHWVLQSGTIVR